MGVAGLAGDPAYPPKRSPRMHPLPIGRMGRVAARAFDALDSDAVIRAMGWTVEPPQPNGHPLPAFNEDLLASVKRRRPFWRVVPPGAQTEAPQRRGRAPGPKRGVPPSERRN